ncbi:MAG TPA: putative quinol monooxygenase [Granulicella sp.]|jgi:quinol monooxygenase YgiN|nr:putative quinol monooxygenase [Granulicella sp.]
MAEVRVIARALAREGKAAELKALLAGMVAPTRAEAGCRFYELFASNIPGLFYFNELWESQAHLDAHVATSHFTEIFAKAKALLAEPLEVNLLEPVE